MLSSLFTSRSLYIRVKRWKFCMVLSTLGLSTICAMNFYKNRPLGWDSPSTTITVFSSSRVFQWKSDSQSRHLILVNLTPGELLVLNKYFNWLTTHQNSLIFTLQVKTIFHFLKSFFFQKNKKFEKGKRVKKDHYHIGFSFKLKFLPRQGICAGCLPTLKEWRCKLLKDREGFKVRKWEKRKKL